MGQTYKINETFYSLQGEGEWTGCAAFFIRLAGCNLNCEFCDTNFTEKEELSIEELVRRAKRHPSKKVIITGGEPCLQDTHPLVLALKKEGFKCHLETNGTLPTHADWDWVAISPKTRTLEPRTVMLASEFKFLCGIPGWQKLLEGAFDTYGFNRQKADAPIVWLMPLAKAYPSTELLPHTVAEAVKYCLKNPRVKLCLQAHKVWRVK